MDNDPFLCRIRSSNTDAPLLIVLTIIESFRLVTHYVKQMFYVLVILIMNTQLNYNCTSSLSNLLRVILCVWFFSGGNINGVRARYSIIVFPET